MIINNNREWKYSIPFDSKLYKQVSNFAEQLDSENKYLMQNTIELHRNHFSFEQMYNVYLKVKKDDEKLEQLKQFVYKNNKCLIYCPKELVVYYSNIIKEKHYEDRYFLNKILKYCSNVKPVYIMEKYYKIIFGKYYKSIIKTLNSYSKGKVKPIEEEKVNRYLLIYETEQILRGLRKNLVVQDEFGISKIRECKSLIKTKFGFGSWHSKEVSGENYFTIHSNSYSLTHRQLENMVYSNVYPGKAHLYNNILTPKFNKTFDHGANLLINGWGQYCAWKLKNDTFNKHNKYINSKIIKFLFSKDYDKGLNELYCFLLTNFEKKQAMDMYIMITQYPDKFESYFLGAIAIDLLVKKGFVSEGEDLIKKLKTMDCGDYFANYIKKKEGR